MSELGADQKDLFWALCRHLGVEPDRRGESHCTCPACGKQAKRGSVHFSFGVNGGFCFVCQFKCSLHTLAAHYGLDDAAPVEPRPARPPRHRYDVLEHDPDDLARRYAAQPEAVEQWQAYKPLSVETIRRYQLGYGVFPAHSSQCTHPRLIVPLFAGGRCVGFRGRSTGCACPKWLSPGGSRMVLYNAHDVTGKLLWVVENPVDALLLEAYDARCAAVATLGVTIWTDEYTELVRPARKVVVAYDADAPGNGGGRAGREAWLATHDRLIEPNGVKLVNRLLAAGIRAVLFPWPEGTPVHTDIGALIAERMTAWAYTTSR